MKDYRIASRSDIPEVTFKFCYDALLKLAIAVCARNNLRVKARQGHHIELIQKMADLLGSKDIKIMGDEMRAKRNLDIYGGGVLISEKEVEEYLKWLKNIVTVAEDHLFGNKKIF
jgi:hypothetical protein